MKTSDNTVLITGGSSGIGLALARKFYHTDNHVIITGRNRERLDLAQQEMPELDIMQADMADHHALEAIVNQFPSVNILINNAAVQHNYDFRDASIGHEQIRSEIDINFTGPLQLIKLYLPHLMQHPASAIVNVTSGLGYVPKQSASVYCGTKSALHMATKALRWQLESTPINVFELIPSLVDTHMTAGRDEKTISPEVLVDEFWTAFQQNQYEINIGRIKQLRLLVRFLPQIAERMMRDR